MKLYYAPTSPFVRKVIVTAAELGIDGEIERIDTATTPVDPDPALAAVNPIGKLPALTTDDGETLYDSAVICEYLAARAGNGAMLPADGAGRWATLRLQALADGLMDAAILRRYEGWIRPEDKRWPDWDAAQRAKVTGALDALEVEADVLAPVPTLGTIAVACALGYLDFRFADEPWRANRPKLAKWYEDHWAKRPSMIATAPPT